AEIGALGVREIIAINKADVADPDTVKQIVVKQPHAVVVSAHTGEGIDELLLAIESELPQPAVAVDVLLPYDRGDLLHQIHQHGEIDEVEHRSDGTHVTARVDADLAADLAPYAS